MSCFFPILWAIEAPFRSASSTKAAAQRRCQGQVGGFGWVFTHQRVRFTQGMDGLLGVAGMMKLNIIDS